MVADMKRLSIVIAMAMSIVTPAIFAKEVNDKLAIGVSLFGIYQYGDFANNLNDTLEEIDNQGGSVLELDLGKWGVNGVWMNSKTGDARDNSFDYLAGQVHYNANLVVGDGTYRLWMHKGSRDFLNPTEDQLEGRPVNLSAA